ncbi:MAG: wax ester/triacylglycerol synthase family O-acyltransferase [Vulcanimicrobiota bacterium]
MNDSEILSPCHYIEKVCLTTGELLRGEIRPEELLVQDYRDYHIVDTYARYLTSVMSEATGEPERIKQAMKKARQVGKSTADIVARVVGKEPAKVAERLFGLKDREHFFRYKSRWTSEVGLTKAISKLQSEAADALEKTRRDGQLQLSVLLTGGTGFVGKEIMWQAATNPEIAEMVVLIRPKTIRDASGEVLKVLSPEERGRELLNQLWLEEPALMEKFRFIAGDIEEPCLGVAETDFERLCCTVTNVIHCAASVAFDDPYADSFRANVIGSRNALAFSKAIQDHPKSRFVSHLSIETSYIHGRQTQHQAREDEIVFPRNFYNNYYELTKAMASLETEEAMLKQGLRVVQLCPAIVIGDGRTGNNRGDMKVVNAPVNAFGRARQELQARRGKWVEWSKAWMLTQMATVFPGDASAEINLIPVDWVALGIIKALSSARAIGQRVHLATDSRITTKEIQTILKEELRVKIKLSEPTFHRNFQLPVLAGALKALKQPRVARALLKLDNIFGGYSERGQPIHEVGNDVEVLGMPDSRPRTRDVFRMLCRHNKYIQEFGQVRDLDEVSRRERVWEEFINELEQQKAQSVGEISPAVFHKAAKDYLDLTKFELREHAAARKRILSKADAAWLHMDRPDNLMMITALFLFDEQLDYQKLRKTVQERLLTYDRFRMRVRRSRNPLRRPSWVPVPDFDLDNHLERVSLKGGSEADLHDFVGRKMSQRLSRRQPLWKIYLVEDLKNGSALVAVLHHAIADGNALMRVLMKLTDPVEEGSDVECGQKGQLIVKPRGFVDLARKGLGATATLGKGLIVTEPPTPFRGALGKAKAVSVSKGISLHQIKQARTPTASTVNDILMAALAGGLRRYILREQGAIKPSVSVRAVVPVDLRRSSGEELGNKFGLIFMALPVGIEDPHARLLEVKKRMNELKESPQAIMVLGLLAAVGAIPAELEKRVVTVFSSRATAVLTNVPGPRSPLKLGGSEISSLMFWVPQSGGLGLGLSILSYHNEVRVGVAVDSGLVRRPEVLVKDFEEAFDELLQVECAVQT